MDDMVHIKNQWVQQCLWDVTPMIPWNCDIKNIFTCSKGVISTSRNMSKLDNIIILGCILAFIQLGATGAPKPTKSLFSSLFVNILQYFLFFWILCFHKLFYRIYISLISFAHAYLYRMLTPTHIWHSATRHCRVNNASSKSENFNCEGQVAQHWCACCYGDWGAELSLILIVLRLTLPYFALPPPLPPPTLRQNLEYWGK